MYTTLIIINANAGSGKALRSWNKIRREVFPQIPGKVYELISYSKECLAWKINEFIEKKQVNCFISAGGDGALNYLVNILYQLFDGDLNRFTVGGIGLGSSNDFIKPAIRYIHDVPIRLNFDNAHLQDIGIVTLNNTFNCRHKRCFLLNASIGVTAEANYFFNGSDGLMQYLKKLQVRFAIWYTAFYAILKHDNIPADLHFNSNTKHLEISNLAIIKYNYISGGFHYDQVVTDNDGLLGVYCCYNMSKYEIMKTLLDLQHGRFSGKPKRISAKVSELEIAPEKCVPIETDGEVFHGKKIRFSVMKNAVNILGL